MARILLLVRWPILIGDKDNGAGKTTSKDTATGKARPEEGTITFHQTTDLTRLDEAETAELGIGRKFQKPIVFESHTVRDNIALALKAPRGLFPTLVARPRLLVLDEPTEGIQPSIIKDIGLAIRYLRGQGAMAILLVEQYFEFARELADRFAVMDRGRVVAAGVAGAMDDAEIRRHLTV